MLKKKETYTKLEFSYQPDVPEGEDAPEYSVVFEMKGMDETIQIISESDLGGDILGQCNNPKLPFHMLSEIVRSIEAWKRSPDAASKPNRPKAPVVTDYREDEAEEIPDDSEGSPAAIQKQVNESMERLDTSQGEISSLIGSSPPPQLDIDGEPDDDPVGITVDDIARLGPVPETPAEFKKQLEGIGRRTPKKE